jgi:hypothetical protein
MSTPAGVAPESTPPAPNEPPAAATTPPVPTPPAQPAAAVPTSNVWDDPKAAQAEIERLRKENGAERVNAKAQAADAAKKEMAQTIAKALGLVEDDANDPAKLTASLTNAQTEAKQARVELAVFRNAATAGADPAALLDSASFLASLAAVDPNDAGAVSAAIAAAVAANPRLGVAPSGTPAVTPPAPNPAQGAGGNGTAGVAQITRAELDRMDPDAIEQARLDGRLNTLLGIK